jgi:hypothetical protein
MNLVERVKNILLQPNSEWPVIAGETTDVKTLYTSYIIILAAIPAVAGFVGAAFIGHSVPLLGSVRIPVTWALTSSIVSYALSLVAVYVLAFIIDALAPSFGGEKNMNQALKTAAYSYTAAWVAGIFSLIPGLGILAILGLYSLYLLYLGLPVMMKSPTEKAVGYTVVVVICGIVLSIVIAAVAGALMVGSAGVAGLG